MHHSLTCNLNFHALVRRLLSVVGHTCIVPSKGRLRSFEMKNSPPSFCAFTYGTGVTLRVHIKVTRLSSVDIWYTCAVTVSPEQVCQFSVAHKYYTAPNATGTVSTKHHWTVKCRARQISCYIRWFAIGIDRTRG